MGPKIAPSSHLVCTGHKLVIRDFGGFPGAAGSHSPAGHTRVGNRARVVIIKLSEW